MERKLENKMKGLNYISSNYQKMWDLSDEEFLKQSRDYFNLGNHKDDFVYKKLFGMKVEDSLEEPIKHICNVAINLIKQRKMDKETYGFFRDTPKEDFWLAISDAPSFLRKLESQL
jgi:hypothetical protein